MSLSRSLLITVLFISLSILLGACGQEEAANEEAISNGNSTSGTINLTFMAAQQSGAWYPLAVGITEMMKKNIDNLGNISIQPGGGVSNVIALNNGTGEIGFSQAGPAADGFLGNPPFQEKMENVKYLLSLFPHQTHIVVPKNSGIATIEDIKGKRINVGTQGLLSEDIASRILEIHGMTYGDMQSVQNLSFSDSVEQMKDGRLDVLFWTVPAPFAVLNDLSQSMEIDFLELPKDTIDELLSQNAGFFKTSLDAGTYNGVDYDVATIQSPIVVIASNETSEDLIYQTTKTIYEGIEELAQINPVIGTLDPKVDLPIDIGVPLHPGAEKFFREQGLLQ
ncbi:TAXI family TRAP transporter solute-binding subunit [Halalkalibacterium ligniniphilum]|uniref:TAXI family TRAP transporter solute-binding subunit n=1 Tax=Halalkalibacterium ligniniphilum TaxID=1134413 RepID=UPI00034D82A7|nr:TAXI family TRAP transporter solute-binding subunit [Halalkalibacterium ligniniphilum]